MMGRAPRSVIDIQMFIMLTGHFWGEKQTPSLTDAANHFLGTRHGVRWRKDKELSVSDWGNDAALTTDQVCYAAWDAWATLQIVREIFPF